jgi:hypothetical protein
MTCEANYSNASAALDVKTWSGSLDNNKDANLTCSIGDKTQATHMVKVTNYRTHDRTIHVQGEIITNINSAKFDGHSSIIVNDKIWRESAYIPRAPINNTIFFTNVRIAKIPKRNGTDFIKTEIEYEDSWNPSNKIPATDPYNPVSFPVDII